MLFSGVIPVMNKYFILHCQKKRKKKKTFRRKSFPLVTVRNQDSKIAMLFTALCSLTITKRTVDGRYIIIIAILPLFFTMN